MQATSQSAIRGGLKIVIDIVVRGTSLVTIIDDDRGTSIVTIIGSGMRIVTMRMIRVGRGARARRMILGHHGSRSGESTGERKCTSKSSNRYRYRRNTSNSTGRVGINTDRILADSTSIAIVVTGMCMRLLR